MHALLSGQGRAAGARRTKGLVCRLVALAIWLQPHLAITAQAQVLLAVTQPALVIREDRGGSVTVRAAEVDALRASGRPVILGPGHCWSSCTMFLGLPNACVKPTTVFGFHGPAIKVPGLVLPPDEFDRWSRLIASYYPPAIRDWYLDQARYVTVGFVRKTGRELIAMGVASCP